MRYLFGSSESAGALRFSRPSIRPKLGSRVAKDDIWLYIARASSRIETANRLIGRRRDDDLRPGPRSFAVGEYVIIYRIDAEEVVILHVMRGSRDIAGLLRE